MPIKITNEGWVKVPPPKVTHKPKPADPVDIFRGPLAYITGRPEFKEPVKKQSLKQLMIEAASIPAPPPPPERLIFDDKPHRSHRSRRRVESASASLPGLSGRPRRIEEVDEEIPRPDLYQEEVQSRRSASPVGSRHGRAGPQSKSKRYASQPNLLLSDENEDHRHSRRGQSSRSKHYLSRSVYDDDDVGNHGNRPYRSNHIDRNYRDRDEYYSRPHHQYNYPPHASTPTLQPIIIYSSPPPVAGCGTHHHGCSSYLPHSCAAPPRPMIERAPIDERVVEARPAPSIAPSTVSSSSSRSRQSNTTRSMSYKWYTATQPLNL